MPYFEIYRAGRKLQDVTIEGLEAVIGRDPKAHVRLEGESVSRQHARVFARQGAWVIEDLGTKNGTFVNGSREYTCELHDGDRVQVDDFVLAFHRPPGEFVPDAPVFQTRGERKQAEARAKGQRWEPLAEPVSDPQLPPLDAESRPAGTRIVDPKEIAKKRQAAMARLVPHLVRDDDPEWTQPLQRAPVTIGSAAKECDVRLPSASRLGVAEVSRRDDGSFLVRWKGLFGGIEVDGRRRRQLVLHDGASFVAHGVTFTFRAGKR